MKTVQWRSEESQLEVLTDFKEPHDCIEAFVNIHRGKPCVVEIENGKKIPCILLTVFPHEHALLFVRRESNPTVMIIRITFIRSISVVR